MKIFIFLFSFIAVLFGFTKSDLSSSPSLPPEVQPEKFFWIGLIPEHNLFQQVERYEPLARYLSEKTGRKVKLKVLSRYGNIIDNFVSEGLDGAFFGSFTYALAHIKLDVEVLTRPQLLNGESTYHGLILVRKNSGIQSARKMKGKIFAFVDKATTAGYLLPLVYFKKNGIKNIHTFFKETYFAGTHEDVIHDVLERKADIGAAKNTVYQRLADRDSRVNRELVILDRSPEVPENGLAVRKDLEESIKKKIQGALLTMHLDSHGKEVLRKFEAQKFIATRDQDYLSVYRYARKANLNLTTYDYRND
jgi:phosphonate transport system substrate-binding protein